MAILTKGTTFADGDQVTSTKLNNLVDSAAFVAGSSGSTDDATLEVASGQLRVKTVQTGNIANSAVTTAKIANSTGAADGVTADKLATGAVTTAKVADANITAAKLNGAQTGTAPIFGVRAWGKFDGTGTSPISPVYGGNVASVTRTGTGVFDISFTTPMANANYSVSAGGTAIVQTNSQAYGTISISNVTVNGFTMTYLAVSTNPSLVYFQVVG
jgi:hypothetical protein